VQQYSKEVYLRTAEASQCRVHSVLVLPLFADAARRGALGVLELVTTTDDDLPFDSIVATLDGILQVPSLQPGAEPEMLPLNVPRAPRGPDVLKLNVARCPAQNFLRPFLPI